MPKEVFGNKTEREGRFPFWMELTWSKEHDLVQISTQAPVGFVKPEAPEWKDVVGGVYKPGNGWAVTLSEEDIDRLIRSLQRVKKQAFN